MKQHAPFGLAYAEYCNARVLVKKKRKFRAFKLQKKEAKLSIKLFQSLCKSLQDQ